MSTPLSKKLRLAPGLKAAVINPPLDYFALLGPLPEELVFLEDPDELDFLHIFATHQSQLGELLPVSLPALKYDGLLWISYPKGSSEVETDLSRDLFWEFLQEYSLRPVAQVSVNEIWSALRFRPEEAVGK